MHRPSPPRVTSTGLAALVPLAILVVALPASCGLNTKGSSFDNQGAGGSDASSSQSAGSSSSSSATSSSSSGSPSSSSSASGSSSSSGSGGAGGGPVSSPED